MEIARLSKGGMGRSRRRGMSQRVYYNTKRTTKAVRFGGGAGAGNYWKIKVATPKLRLVSPVKVWSKFKVAYTKMRLNLGCNSNKKRQHQPKMTNTEFDNRLIFEIYKSLSVSMELHNTNN